MSTPRMTQAEFIRRARAIHGTRYSYVKTIYEYAKQPVTITCKMHGDFSQRPKKHYEGNGCPSCKCDKHSERMSNRISVPRKEFLVRAREKFGQTFKYRGEYLGLLKPIEIWCATHGWFKATPTHHLQLKTGCADCGNNRPTTEQFVVAAQKVHGSKYDYSKTVCANAGTKVIVICKLHGEFSTTQRKHLGKSGRAQGCRKCGLLRHADTRFDKSADRFLSEARTIHGKLYDYSKVVYAGVHEKLEIVCKKHGSFWQEANNHLNGQGCPACIRTVFCSKETLQVQASKVHGTKYDYSKFEFVNLTLKGIIVCKVHGQFLMSMASHLRGADCHRCIGHGYSKIAIKWLEDETKRRRLKSVQHAENVGEFCIPGTRLRADGYHARSNTVFEFYGDIYHGNLNVYKPADRPNPYSALTTKQLFNKTMKREEFIKSLGYNVVSIWESDYRASLKVR